MTDKSKLLKMVQNAIDTSPDSVRAANVIAATADWFEEVLKQIGIQPSSIPTLLRHQAYQEETYDD